MKLSKPYYAVIFTSTHSDNVQGYSEMSEQMEALAKCQDGFIGLDTARSNVGITISYWKSIEAIKAWKSNSEHMLAQRMGRTHWYDWYNVRICKVEQEYDFIKDYPNVSK